MKTVRSVVDPRNIVQMDDEPARQLIEAGIYEAVDEDAKHDKSPKKKAKP